MMPGTEQNFAGVLSVFQRKPDAIATISGSAEYPEIHGTVRFYQVRKGVVVAVEIAGLPQGTDACGKPFFGFHIHSGGVCRGNEKDPFADTLSHYNPDHCTHPAHAGDLLPLLGNSGVAMQIFLTNRFTVQEIAGRTVVIHAQPDDFTSQPAGNSGSKIACGEIRMDSLRK